MKWLPCLALAIAAHTGAVSLVAQSPATPGYARIDAYADAAPSSAEQSVQALAAYLGGAGADEMAKARAVYRWVTRHIDYDTKAFFSHQYGDRSPDAVLRSRASICSGYAGLAEALGTAMGLEIRTVSGWSKGYGYRTGDSFTGPTNHAWNAVKIGGQWKLMDPTWGAGYLNQGNQFERHFREHYFMTPPEAFVFDHLPQDPQWQLLEHPWSSDQYAQMAYLRPMFFTAGFRIGSHPRAVIDARDTLLVTLGVTRPVELRAELVDAATDRPLGGVEHTLVQLRADQAEVHAAFPRPGAYLLRLFARPQGDSASLQWVLDYRVNATKAAADATFPLEYREFSAHGEWLYEPVNGTLEAGHTRRFRLRAPGAIDVAVVIGNQWTHFHQAGDEFTADVPVTAGDVIVYAKYDAASNYSALLKYIGR